MSNSPVRSFFVAPALAGILCVCAVGIASAAPLTLKAGDPAPEFKVATWLKGKPVKRLEQGNVYVLEFWATRCAPCIKALPHLKELSEHYKEKVTFLAIGQPYEWETVESIREFVRRKDDLMPYAVGLDALHGKGERMYDQWGPPAGFAGLPVTIVVDGSGRIAWTGMPTELDEPLQQIVAGTHDIQAARRQQEADHAAADVNSAQRESFRAMLAAKDYAAVIQRVDTLAARNPGLEAEVYAYKLMALLETDPPEAVAYAQGLPPALQGDAASMLAERDGLPKPAYEFIAAELEKALSNPDTHVMSWQMLATTYHRLGKLDRAIEVQQAALKKSDDMGYTEFSVQLRGKLEQYQAEKAKQGSSEGFTINGRVIDIPDQKITLTHSGESSGKTPEALETQIVGGKFRLSGVIDRPPAIYELGLETRGMPIRNWELALDNSAMTMVLRVKEKTAQFTMLEQSLSGSPANDLFVKFKDDLDRRFNEPLEQLFGRQLALKPKAGEQAGAEQKAEIERLGMEIQALLDKQTVHLQKMAASEKDNLNALFALRALAHAHQYPYSDSQEVEALFSALAPAISKSGLAQSIKPQMLRMAKVTERAQAVAKGAVFKDFVQHDPEGNPVQASELLRKGGYLLVDFWASWCVPCRAEHPYLVSAYRRYQDRGFELLGVSLDTNRKNWLAAIKEDGLLWKQVSDLHGAKNAVAVLYGVKAIPMNFLIDGSGKIVATNLKGQQLEDILAEGIGGTKAP